MKQLILVVVVAGVAFAIGRWSANAPVLATAKGTSTSSSESDRALGARAVLRIDPRRDRFSASAPTTPLAPPPSPAVAAFRSGKDYAALYAQLVAGEQSGESLWLQAELLRRCGKRQSTQKDEAAGFRERTPEEQRQEFLEGILPNDPNRAVRIADYDRLSLDPCEGMRETKYSSENLKVLLERSAALGDDRAQLSLAEMRRYEAFNDAYKKGQAFPKNPITDQELAELKSILGRGNAEAAQLALSRLAFGGGGALVLGDSPAAANRQALASAIELLQCDLGVDCSANSRRLQGRCAIMGECGADNLIDATYFYSASPYHAQLIDQYRSTLQTMIRNRDFSQLRFERNPTPQPPASTTPTVPTKR